MNPKLFFSIFCLIFMAELGDKTQLAVMAKSAAGDKWTVFFAATLALACSTLVAVLFGSALEKFIDPKYIKMGAGCLFVIFGLIIIYTVVRGEEPETVEVTAPAHGLMARVAFEMAAEFEAAAADDYDRLADDCDTPALKGLLMKLANEERSHLDQVRKGLVDFNEHTIPETDDAAIPAIETLAHDVSEKDKPIVEHAIEHELATAGFYEALAKASSFQGLKSVFGALAAEEREHARHLQEFLA